MDYYWCVQSAVCVECEIGKKIGGSRGDAVYAFDWGFRKIQIYCTYSILLYFYLKHSYIVFNGLLKQSKLVNGDASGCGSSRLNPN